MKLVLKGGFLLDILVFGLGVCIMCGMHNGTGRQLFSDAVVPAKPADGSPLASILAEIQPQSPVSFAESSALPSGGMPAFIGTTRKHQVLFEKNVSGCGRNVR